MQIKLVGMLDRRQQQEIERLPALLDERRIAEHVQRAVAAAPLLTDPYEHIVVEQLLPDDVYELLIRAIPPVEFFDNRDPIKQNLWFPMEFGPTFSATVWDYVDDVIARRVIRSAVLEKLQEPLQRHFATIFGPAFVERANSLPQSVSGGRLMLRRRGYHLGPHRDPKRAMLTCLLYLARTGDSEAYGTQICRVLDDEEAGYKQTYYPVEEGRSCEFVKVVPFRPNTMLASLNSRGAHGAVIPSEAPDRLQRCTFNSTSRRTIRRSRRSSSRCRRRSGPDGGARGMQQTRCGARGPQRLLGETNPVTCSAGASAPAWRQWP